MKRKYKQKLNRKWAKQMYNSIDWRWFWSCKNKLDTLDNINVIKWWEMKKELYTVKYLNNKYEQYKR